MSDSRKEPRHKLAELLGTVPGIVESFDHEALDFKGKSPVSMVHSDGTGYLPGLKKIPANRRHSYLISLWWGPRTADTEDQLDDLEALVRTYLESWAGPCEAWRAMTPDDDFSFMDYPRIDGKAYRRTLIRVHVW